VKQMEYEIKESAYLKASDIKGVDNVSIELLSEVKDVNTSWGNKPQCEAKITNGKETTTKTYQLNQPTINYLVGKFGKQSSNWVGKKFDATTTFIKGNDAIVPKVS